MRTASQKMLSAQEPKMNLELMKELASLRREPILLMIGICIRTTYAIPLGAFEGLLGLQLN